MAEHLKWSKFVTPIPRQRQRLIEVTNVGPEGQFFFDPVSHYMFRETHLPHNLKEWHVADLPCTKGKPKP